MEKAKKLKENLVDIYKYFKSYNPDAKRIEFDFSSGTYRLTILLSMFSSQRRIPIRISIPEETRVVDVIELDTGRFLPISVSQRGGKSIVKLTTINNKLLLTLKGMIDPELISNIFKQSTSLSPNIENGVESHWIHASLKDTSIIRELYESLEIENIYTPITLDIASILRNNLPEDIFTYIASQRAVIDSIIKGKHVQSYKYRKSIGQIKGTPARFLDNLISLLTGPAIEKYLAVNKPFWIVSSTPGTVLDIFPNNFTVTIGFSLSLHNPSIKGLLHFRRRDFTRYIRRTFRHFHLQEE